MPRCTVCLAGFERGPAASWASAVVWFKARLHGNEFCTCTSGPSWVALRRACLSFAELSVGVLSFCGANASVLALKIL